MRIGLNGWLAWCDIRWKRRYQCIRLERGCQTEHAPWQVVCFCGNTRECSVFLSLILEPFVRVYQKGDVIFGKSSKPSLGTDELHERRQRNEDFC